MRSAGKGYWLIFALGIGLILGASLFGRHVFTHYLIDQTQERLLAQAQVKAGQIHQGLNELRNHGQLFVTRQVIRAALTRWDLGTDARNAIIQMQRHLDMRRIVLFTPDGKPLAGQPTEGLGKDLTAALQTAPPQTPRFIDLYRTSDGDIVYGWLVPVRDDDKTIGSAYFERSAKRSLYPDLLAWPTATSTGETLLAERQGDDMVFLSPLRYRGDLLPLSLRLPTTTSETLAERGLNSETGLLEGEDYVGAPVIGVAFRIIDTPWIMVSKIGRDEATHMADIVTILTMAIALATLALFSVAFWALAHNRLHHATESRDRVLQAILDNVPQGMVLMDCEHRIMAFNSGAYTLFGLPASCYWLGRDFRDLLTDWANHCGFDEHALARAKTNAESATPFELELPLRFGHDDGWFTVTHTPLANGGYVRTFSDISRAKRSEREIKKLNTSFVAMLDNATDFIYFKDQDSRIIFCSQAMARITGYDDWRSMVGKHDFEIFPAETATIYNEEEKPIFEKGEIVAGKINPYFDENGTKGWVETYKWPVRDDDSGAVVGVFGISRDVTARVQLEKALARSNAELEQFAYVVSHDLRQPLRMVSSYCTLLKRQLGENLSNDASEFMDFIVDGARRMNEMMVSLLEYSRVGRMGEPMALIDSRAMADEAIRFLRPQIEDRKADLTISGQWPEIWASANEMTRLFQNLIGNALKYQPPGALPAITLDCAKHNGEWRFCVADNGIGIEESQIERLFKVFQRLHPVNHYEGTGIGLAVCRKIVERHGGHIWAQSAGPGQGSAFCFTLPLAESQAPSQSPERGPARS